jgi:hypothetical protein
MGDHYQNTHGIQLDQSPTVGESYAAYRAKLSRVDIPVTIKTEDQAQGLREFVHGIRLAEKHLGVKI